MRPALVVTTINPPTPQVRVLAEGARSAGWDFVVVVDDKTPHGWVVPGVDVVNARGSTTPPGYARKNAGYLEAMWRGAPYIVETDDDNAPMKGFFAPRSADIKFAGLIDVVTSIPRDVWVNTHDIFARQSPGRSWPRGFPLARLRDAYPAQDAQDLASNFYCPVQQSLVAGDPDVDAVYRMTRGHEGLRFDQGELAVVLRGVWAPINSQNTTWFPWAYPLMYLPATCSWRAADIWRGYVAQRVMRTVGVSVLHTGPTLWQDRNPHDLMVDFTQEVDVYLNVEKVVAALGAVDLEKAPDPFSVLRALVDCYAALIEIGVVQRDEAKLLKDWVEAVYPLSTFKKEAA